MQALPALDDRVFIDSAGTLCYNFFILIQAGFCVNIGQ